MPPEVMRMARGIASLAAVAVLAACASNAPPPRAPEKVLQPVGRTTAPAATQQASARTGPLRIALLAPLSGDFADAGRELVNGAAMALFETPEADAEIMAFDTKGDAEAARTALAAAVDGRADVVVGPLFGRNAGAIAPDLAAAGLAALAFSNDGAAAGPNVVV
ncbi:MAG: penicillin-binding protein activator, partial [Alphaproteobacteria bacterium]